MNRRAIIAVAVAAVLFIGGSIGVFFATHERREVEVREPPVGEARSNQYLALERLWSEYGHAVESVASRSEAPATWSADPGLEFDVVMFARPDSDVPAEELYGWVEWVEKGGTLIVTVPSDGAPTSLLRRLGFAAADESAPEGERGPSFTIESTPWETSGHLGPLVRSGDRRWMSDTESMIALERSVGSGRVIVVSDMSLLNNGRIGKAEHAEFAVELLAAESGAVVLIARHPTRVSWLDEVVERTWPILVGLALLLLFAVQAGRVRFGPLLPTPELSRRRRLEHIEAVGRFLWKNGESASLCDATRQALFAALRRLRRLPRGASDPTAEDLAEALDIPVAEAREVLRDPRPKPTEFVTWIRQIETYRRNL